MRDVVVERILWAGTQGGAIFSATDAGGARHRLVAAPAVMPRPPVAGEAWQIEGVLRRHPEHGPQVEVQRASLQRPGGRLVIQLLARSPEFPGIGEAFAGRLWERFGEALYTLLDAGDSAPFVEVLGRPLAEVLVRGWKALALEAAAFAWLDRHGLPVWLAKKLLGIYGEEMVEKLEDNPYRLLAFTSWKVADGLARALGVPPEDERRLVAAADAVVYRRLQLAHTWDERDSFATQVRGLLGCSGETARKAISLALEQRSLVEVGDGVQGLGPASMERHIVSRLHGMLSGEFRPEQSSMRMEPDEEFLRSFFVGYQERHGMGLNPAQREAVALALRSPVAIVAGGAGVGKTTVLQAILEAAAPLGAQVHMMALSGRAARRMSEAAGRPASTIAGFLQAVDAGRIKLDGEPTLAVDEVSMLDLPTTYRLLRRLEPGCRLLFLGDPGQLPPIGFGVVFHALVESSFVPKVELTQIHRQAAHTGIPQVSLAVREGRVPELREFAGKGFGVSFVDCPAEEVADKALEIVQSLGGFGPTQIISPVKGGPAGTRAINHLCHETLAAGQPTLGGFAVGEPVIWLVNDYDLELMNGSLGVVSGTGGALTVAWDEGEKTMEDVRRMDLAYAITTHKAQGSQWERVVVPVFDSRLLDRALLYTAITRAKSQVVLLGDRRVFERAVAEPAGGSRRRTGMGLHLASP